MSTSFAVTSLIEVIVGAFIIWGFFNESKFVDFEEKIIKKFKVRRTPAKITKFTPSSDRSGRSII